MSEFVASNLSNAAAVREFTNGAGQPTPDHPSAMTEGEVRFITKMILDETMELLATMYPASVAKQTMKTFIDDSKDLPMESYKETDTFQKIADQADALVDIYYYSLNAACKKGMNLSAIFGIVHQANMNKRDPATGKFIKRESDGKIIKPAGWTPPDVEGEIQRQLQDGAWSSGSKPTSNAAAVREFTNGAGQPTPDHPSAMTEGEVRFITKMILDETMELLATMYPASVAKQTMKTFIDDSKDLPMESYKETDTFQKIADQADALVDIYYYSLNAACKKGMNLSAIFGIVHQANMNKRDPATGKFIKRESDGKIIKPAGWTPPDVEGEIQRQLQDGAWKQQLPADEVDENEGIARAN